MLSGHGELTHPGWKCYLPGSGRWYPTLEDREPVDISVGRTAAQLANQALLPHGCYYMPSHSVTTRLLFNPNVRALCP